MLDSIPAALVDFRMHEQVSAVNEDFTHAPAETETLLNHTMGFASTCDHTEVCQAAWFSWASSCSTNVSMPHWSGCASNPELAAQLCLQSDCLVIAHMQTVFCVRLFALMYAAYKHGKQQLTCGQHVSM